jgi:hypothetical protein
MTAVSQDVPSVRVWERKLVFLFLILSSVAAILSILLSLYIFLNSPSDPFFTDVANRILMAKRLPTMAGDKKLLYVFLPAIAAGFIASTHLTIYLQWNLLTDRGSLWLLPLWDIWPLRWNLSPGSPEALKWQCGLLLFSATWAVLFLMLVALHQWHVYQVIVQINKAMGLRPPF